MYFFFLVFKNLPSRRRQNWQFEYCSKKALIFYLCLCSLFRVHTQILILFCLKGLYIHPSDCNFIPSRTEQNRSTLALFSLSLLYTTLHALCTFLFLCLLFYTVSLLLFLLLQLVVALNRRGKWEDVSCFVAFPSLSLFPAACAGLDANCFHNSPPPINHHKISHW